jgi:hypothetical protein
MRQIVAPLDCVQLEINSMIAPRIIVHQNQAPIDEVGEYDNTILHPDGTGEDGPSRPGPWNNVMSTSMSG